MGAGADQPSQERPVAYWRAAKVVQMEAREVDVSHLLSNQPLFNVSRTLGTEAHQPAIRGSYLAAEILVERIKWPGQSRVALTDRRQQTNVALSRTKQETK